MRPRQAAASATRSILGMLRVSPKPGPDVMALDDLTDDAFSMLEPTRNHLEDDEALFEMIERGHGVSFVLY
jgi:SpoU rRNA methylase family enzyme